MADQGPSKKWRVIDADGNATDYRGQAKAYSEGVKLVTDAGGSAYAYQWDRGRWGKYEAIGPHGADLNSGWPDDAGLREGTS